MLVVGKYTPHTTRRMREGAGRRAVILVIPAVRDGVAFGAEKPDLGRSVAGSVVRSFRDGAKSGNAMMVIPFTATEWWVRGVSGVTKPDERVGMRTPRTGMRLLGWVLVRLVQWGLVKLSR